MAPSRPGASGSGSTPGPTSTAWGPCSTTCSPAAPRDGKTPIEVLERARVDPIVPPRRKNPRIPRGLERICLKAMAADPQSRYPSADALRPALRRFRLMRRSAPMLGAAAAVLTLLVMTWAFRPGSVKPSVDGQAGAVAGRGTTDSEIRLDSPPHAELRVTHFEISHFPKMAEDRMIGNGPACWGRSPSRRTWMTMSRCR